MAVSARAPWPLSETGADQGAYIGGKRQSPVLGLVVPDLSLFSGSQFRVSSANSPTLRSTRFQVVHAGFSRGVGALLGRLLWVAVFGWLGSFRVFPGYWQAIQANRLAADVHGSLASAKFALAH